MTEPSSSALSLNPDVLQTYLQLMSQQLEQDNRDEDNENEGVSSATSQVLQQVSHLSLVLRGEVLNT